MYTIISDSADKTPEWWENEDMFAKVKQTDADMENGKDKGIKWEEAKKQLQSADLKTTRNIK